MSWHAVFVTPNPPHFADGPLVASTQGWDDFCTFVEARPDQFPECAYLTDNPVDEAVPGSLARLAAELPQVQEAASGDPDVAGVAASLAKAMAAMPAGCLGIYVSDGEPGEAEYEEAESNVY